MPKVAIITRTQDRLLFLERTINSVINQSETDWEHVIIVDAGPFEQVQTLVNRYKDKYKGRVKLIHNQTSSGMEAASNKGIKASDSEYVVIHDDDDSWDTNFLKKTTALLDNPPIETVKGVITWSQRIDETVKTGKIIIDKRYGFNTDRNLVLLEDMAAGNFFPPISFLYKRSVFKEIGYYDESLRYRGDWEFNLRFLCKYDIHLIPEALANYHFRDINTPSNFSNSVISGSHGHEFYTMVIRNRLLRADLESGKSGLGYLVNFASHLRTIEDKARKIEEDTNSTRSFIRKLTSPLRGFRK